MKKIIKQKPQNEQVLDVLKRLATRIEEATVDISSIKTDLKFVNLRFARVEHNTDIMKVDIEKMRQEIGGIKNEMGEMKTEMTTMKKDIKEIKKDTEGLVETTAHILKEAVTHDEHNDLSQRVSALEQS
jgi:chromosome segregation ATPase